MGNALYGKPIPYTSQHRNPLTVRLGYLECKAKPRIGK